MKKGQFDGLTTLALGIAVFVIILVVLGSVFEGMDTSLRQDTSNQIENKTLIVNRSVSLTYDKLIGINSIKEAENLSHVLDTADYDVDLYLGLITLTKVDDFENATSCTIDYNYYPDTNVTDILSAGSEGIINLSDWTDTIIAIAIGMLILGMVFFLNNRRR